MPVEGATSAQRNIADHYQHCGWTMNNGTLRLALDHATKGRHYDTVESDVVKAVVSSHAAREAPNGSIKRTAVAAVKRAEGRAIHTSRNQTSWEFRLFFGDHSTLADFWLPYRISVSALAIMHSPRSADSDCREAAVDSQIHAIHVARFV